MRIPVIAVLILAALLTPFSSFGALAATAPFTVHVVNMPQVAFANAFVVETRKQCIVIDAGFSDKNGKAILEVARATGKPIKALLLTHAHIDHYGGMGVFRAASIPIVTSEGVARQIDEWDAINMARFGGAPPPGPRRPDRTPANGESIELDGVKFTMYDSGPGESYSDVWWMVSSGNSRAAFIGDLAMYGLPPFTQSGHSADWIRSLEGLKTLIPEGVSIYIGHDVKAVDPLAAANNAKILQWQIQRLRAFRNVVAGITGRRRLLTDEEVAIVIAKLNEDAPENLTAFNFLIATSANVLAAELISEQVKEEFERKLQAVLMEAGS